MKNNLKKIFKLIDKNISKIDDYIIYDFDENPRIFKKRKILIFFPEENIKEIKNYIQKLKKEKFGRI